METEAKAKVVAYVYCLGGGGGIYSIPCRGSCFALVGLCFCLHTSSMNSTHPTVLYSDHFVNLGNPESRSFALQTERDEASRTGTYYCALLFIVECFKFRKKI